MSGGEPEYACFKCGANLSDEDREDEDLCEKVRQRRESAIIQPNILILRSTGAIVTYAKFIFRIYLRTAILQIWAALFYPAKRVMTFRSYLINVSCQYFPRTHIVKYVRGITGATLHSFKLRG